MLRSVFVALLVLCPGTLALEIAEVHPAPSESAYELIEVILENATSGSIIVADTYAADEVSFNFSAPYSGRLLIVPYASHLDTYGNLSCPALVLDSPIGNGLANAGDTITVTSGNHTDTFSYESAPRNVSYHRSCEAGNCTVVFGPLTPCEPVPDEPPEDPEPPEGPIVEPEPDRDDESSDEEHEDESDSGGSSSDSNACTPPRIVFTRDVYSATIEYRILAEESYRYRFELLNGTIVKEPFESKTSSEKRFTPHLSHERDFVFVLIVEYEDCAGEDRTIRRYVPYETPDYDEPACIPDTADVYNAMTPELKEAVCADVIEALEVCEIAREAPVPKDVERSGSADPITAHAANQKYSSRSEPIISVPIEPPSLARIDAAWKRLVTSEAFSTYRPYLLPGVIIAITVLVGLSRP